MFDNITKVPIDFNFPYFSFPLIMNHHTVLHTFDIKRFRLTLDGTVWFRWFRLILVIDIGHFFLISGVPIRYRTIANGNVRFSGGFVWHRTVHGLNSDESVRYQTVQTVTVRLWMMPSDYVLVWRVTYLISDEILSWTLTLPFSPPWGRKELFLITRTPRVKAQAKTSVATCCVSLAWFISW